MPLGSWLVSSPMMIPILSHMLDQDRHGSIRRSMEQVRPNAFGRGADPRPASPADRSPARGIIPTSCCRLSLSGGGTVVRNGNLEWQARHKQALGRTEVVMDHGRNVSFTIQLSSLKFYKIRVGFLNYLN